MELRLRVLAAPPAVIAVNDLEEVIRYVDA